MEDQLADVKKLLGLILDELRASKVSLGFQESVLTPVYLNSVKSPGHVWYRIVDGEQIPIKDQAFTGYLTRIERVTETRREKDSEKLHLWMEGKAGALYRFECGWGRQTFKSLISAIASLSPDEIKQPITLYPYVGKDPSVLFVKLYLNRKAVFSPYGDDTDWDALWSAATQNLGSASDSIGPVEPETKVKPTPSPMTVVPGVSGSGVIDQVKLNLSHCNTIDDLVALAFWLHDSQEGESLREVPESYGWVLEKIKERANMASCSIVDVLAGTDVEMRRLGWTAQQGRDYLFRAYRKRSRQELHQGQLIDFLAFLKSQPNNLLSRTSRPC